MRAIRIADPKAAEAAGLPLTILDVNRKDRIILVTNEEYAGIPTSGVLGDELEDLGPFFLTELATGVTVAVPTIADAEIDEVAVDVASAFTQSVAVGDFVLVTPEAALPTSAVFMGAYVSATDEVTISFGALEGGSGVTGANVAFSILLLKNS